MEKEQVIEQMMINTGLAIKNADGTYALTDQGYSLVQEMFSKKPELYVEIFKDRLN